MTNAWAGAEASRAQPVVPGGAGAVVRCSVT